MRLPNRKPGKYTFATFDPKITRGKLADLQKKLARLKATLPQAIKETQQHAENGDFSENAEYQIAKGRLRGLNQSITELDYQINHTKIIPDPTDTHTVQIGHHVTLATEQGDQTFHILSANEVDPKAGIISYRSPIGAALLGHRAGETISLNLGGRTKQFTILAIK